jgi:aryl-alcohol dehydrogenase-like predicted oxidoreductase
VDISVIGLGTATIGSDPAADGGGIAAIERAVELGVNWIDTAPIYGDRRSEGVVGQAIRSMPRPPLIFGKTSMTVADGRIVHSLDPAKLRTELEASLLRLGLDAMDVLFVHWPIPDEGIEEGWAALDGLRREGKTRFLGVSNFSVEQLRRAAGVARVDVAQAAYSMIIPAPEDDLLPFCSEEGIGFLAYAPMGSGLFVGAITRERLAAMVGDHRKHAPAFTEPSLTHSLELYERVQEMASSHGVGPGVVAVAWALSDPRVSGAIVGVRQPRWVQELVPAAVDLVLSAEELRLIRNWMTPVHAPGAR